MLGWANHFEPPLGAPNTLSLYAANANVNRKGPGISRPFAVAPWWLAATLGRVRVL